MYTEFDIENAKNILRDSGYMVESLWSLPDVLSNYETQEGDEVDGITAYELLENAVTGGWIMEQIWETIDNLACDNYNLKRKEDE